MKNHLLDLFGNIRDSTKTVLGGNLLPLAGIRVNFKYYVPKTLLHETLSGSCV